MKNIKAISILGSSVLVLSGCSTAVFSTDGGCGVIVPNDATPNIYAELSPDISMDVGRLLTDISWKVSSLPTDPSNVYSGAITTLPISELVSFIYSEAPFAVASVDEKEYHIPIPNPGAELELGSYDADSQTFSATGHEVVSSALLSDVPFGGPEASLISSLLSHLPVTLISSCGSDYTTEVQGIIDAALADLSDPGSYVAELTDASAEVIYPGLKENFINFELAPDGLGFAISSRESGWYPATTAISVWDREILGSGGPTPEELPLTDLTEDWLAMISVLEVADVLDLGSEDASQPIIWSSPVGIESEFAQEGVELTDDGVMYVDLNQKLNYQDYAELFEYDDEQISADFEHFVLYSSFVKFPEMGSSADPEVAYAFQRFAANQNGELMAVSASAGPIDIDQVAGTDPHDAIVSALFENSFQDQDLVSSPKINGLTAAEYDELGESERILHQNFGTFDSGNSLVGLESGLVVVPGYNPESMLLTDAQATESEFGREGSYYTGAGETLADDETRPNTVAGALAKTVEGVLEEFYSDVNFMSTDFEQMDGPGPSNSLVDTTTFSFVLDPTADFFKMDFVLGMTETGVWDDVNQVWTDYIVEFPDGLGIFVKSESESWLDAANCAAVPTTNTYLSMPAAGILPPGDPTTNASTARQNYLELVRETARDGFSLSTGAAVGFELTEPEGELIPPPMIAMATEQNSAVRFVTTAMTCVVDISEIRSGQDRVEVGIAVANVSDAIFPPAMFVSNGSIRFADNAVAAQQIEEQAVIELVEQEEELEQQTQAVAAPYAGPVISSGTVSASPGGEVTLTGTSLGTVSSVEIDGQAVMVDSATEQQLTFRLPVDISAGSKDLVLISDFGRLLLSGALQVSGSAPSAAEVSAVASIKRIGDTARLFAVDIIGAGKVQFFLDGREIAWIRAVDETDPKLFFANDTYYLVRRVELSEGKNVFEIYIDGERVRRAAYTLR